MTQNGGLVLLFAWLMYGTLLTVLAFFLLRPPGDPDTQAHKKPEDPSAVR